MYLLDTNIFLELILNQRYANDVEQLLRTIPMAQLYVSDFSIHSIGVVLTGRRYYETFSLFVHDILIVGGMRSLALRLSELEFVTEAALRLGLDFDDAYQYVVAAQHELIMVSFDADFDRTDRGRMTPDEVLARPR